MNKRKVYTLTALIFILLATVIVAYPVVGYYFGQYRGSNHNPYKPGSSFTYVGELVTRTYVYHFEVLQNGSYNFTAILYRGTPSYGYSSTKNPPKDWRWPFFTTRSNGEIRKICQVNMVLSRNDSLVRLFFPRENVYILNKTRPIVKLPPLGDNGYINWYFLPHYVGFPRLYAPLGLERFNKSLAIKLNSSFYFPIVRYLKGDGGYYALGVRPRVPQTFELLQIGRVFGNCINTTPLIWMYKGDFPNVLLVRTNVQPLSQDWVKAFKYSFTSYVAPVDYVLLLAGIVLLILAGRAKG
ncbi:hypothetical protein [Thermococcus sp. Bubb.Bath]|uniref:hypothetical protein n=1 Tax=Thermococcus sp. Bubb.Bath TaxID=1638242 RepID=UPI00143C5DCE|nr:hypothetical protein [Thermococcus sp. Bubb.Bath]NJF24847.1 hypothetical protein [Thermococcus sp. Bubb.Bath]